MDMSESTCHLTLCERAVKRGFDILFSVIGLTLTFWIIILAWIVASIDTRKSGFFKQTRIGRNGIPFNIIKIRTMKDVEDIDTVVTTRNDPRITACGLFFRRTKIDELPQLINVLLGNMSFVGPRPDVAGFANQLVGDDRVILSVRPGITGAATLMFRDEETLLANQKNPEEYNRTTLYPEKVRLNRIYIEKYSLMLDIGYILETVTGLQLIKNDGRECINTNE